MEVVRVGLLSGGSRRILGCENKMTKFKIGDKVVASSTYQYPYLPKKEVMTIIQSLCEGQWMVKLSNGAIMDVWDDEIVLAGEE